VLPAVTKAQLGLSGGREEDFLFASFNQPFKISRRVFDVWMRVLRRTNKAMWLLKLNEGVAAEENLLKAAEARGVRRASLFLTGAAEFRDHVAYKSAADVMLDVGGGGGDLTEADLALRGALDSCGHAFRGGADSDVGWGEAVIEDCGVDACGVGAGVWSSGRQLTLVSECIARDVSDYEEVAVRAVKAAQVWKKMLKRNRLLRFGENRARLSLQRDVRH
jgi:hypothetical protein